MNSSTTCSKVEGQRVATGKFIGESLIAGIDVNLGGGSAPISD